ncbi:hypothetical protein B0O99DRAFT_695180 [Bisporella sp. PMI_857]|nr:hypothetical protein B0O99DRAFT_695180 [Bisporella sp. PMI_857]
MSSARSSRSPAPEESDQPRKKGARGGKRSVTHLTKAQLARKRANDREAQRNIRARTKEHIETLEKRVKELESGGRSSSVERIIQRNEQLEEEVEELRTQLARTQSILPGERPSNISEELVITQKPGLEWLPDPESGATPWMHRGSQEPQTDSAGHLAHIGAGASYPLENQLYPQAVSKYEDSEEPQDLYTPTAVPIWNDQIAFDENSQGLLKPTPAWAPFHPALSQPSRFADLSPTGFSEVISTPTFPNTTCWQSQPSVYAWQISTKLKAPVTLVDQLMFSVIHSQRHLHITQDVNGESLIGPEFPSVNVLFDQPAPAKPPSTLTEVMARYAAVLSNRGFALIPEKLASFMCMYRFVQWQISPDYNTYKALHDWQAPCSSQLSIPHPAWMDLPPWPSFRDKVIRNQGRYDNVEFQNDYATNLSVNFPYDPMKALVFEDGQIMVSQLMDRHLSNIKNMSMKRPFALKYPEFKDVCRFDEV